MSLLAIVYKSLFIFGALFVAVVTFSYIAFKIKEGKRTKFRQNSRGGLTPALASASSAPASGIKKNFNTQYFYDKNSRQKGSRLTASVNNGSRSLNQTMPHEPLYTRLSTLTEESPNFRRSNARQSSTQKSSETIGKTMKIRLEGFNVFDYYEENSSEDFYRFKTKG